MQDRRSGRARVISLARTRPTTPAPPAGLLKPSIAAWEAFWGSDVAQAIDPASDGHRVERWITYLDEWARAMRAFRKARLSTGSTGQLVLSPLASYVRQLEVALAAAETELGMTPLARLKLGLAAGQARLTAQQLNDAFEQRSEPEVIVDGWTPA